MTVSPNRNPVWTKDLGGILFGIHKTRKKDPVRADRDTAGENTNDAPADDKVDLVIWNYKDPRLQSQQQVEESRDKNFSFLAEFRPAEKKFIRFADDTVRDVTPAVPEDK